MRGPTLLALNHPSTRSQTARTHFCSERPFKLFKLVNSTEKAMATHSSALAWKIPWTEEPGRLQSMGSRRVGHDWSDLAAAAAAVNSESARLAYSALPILSWGNHNEGSHPHFLSAPFASWLALGLPHMTHHVAAHPFPLGTLSNKLSFHWQWPLGHHTWLKHKSQEYLRVGS